MSLERTIYEGPFVHCQSLTELDICIDGRIGVDEHGKIAFVLRDGESQVTEGWENVKPVRISSGHGFFFPGFIDTHIHAPQYPNAGVFGKSTLLDWLETYTFPLESSFKDSSQARRIYTRVVQRTLSHGTTTACYYATIHVAATNLLADICQARGQRAFVGRVCMDQSAPAYYQDMSVEAAIRDTEQCISHVKRIDPDFGLITPIITPRFAVSCSSGMLSALGKLHHDSGVPCQTHISENKSECALVAELFPQHRSYTDVYDQAGLLTSKMILAHAIHLDDDELALIKKRDAKISHCPVSNTSITSGTAKVRKLLDLGLSVGLGSDVSGGYTPSILAEAREAIMVSRHVAMTEGDRAKLSVEEALYLATRGGAKVVGLDHRIGGFDVGMDWDAQMISLGHVGEETTLDQQAGLVDLFGGESFPDMVAKWVYTGDDRNTRAVWVKGRLVHEMSSA